MARPTLLPALVAAAALALPAGARADTLFAANGGGGITCSQSQPCTLAGAVVKADLTPTVRDAVVVLGPLTTVGTIDLTASPIDLVGSGRGSGGTQLTSPTTALLVGPQSTAAAFEARSSAPGNPVVQLNAGAQLGDADVKNLGAGDGLSVTGADPLDTAIDDVQVSSLSGDALNASPAGAGVTRVRDTSLRGGGAAIAATGRRLVVQRAAISAEGAEAVRVGQLPDGAQIELSSSVIRAGGSNQRAVYVTTGGTAILRNVTLDGEDAVNASRGVFTNGGTATAVVRDSIVVGFEEAFERVAGTGAFTVGTTDFPAASVVGAVDTSPGGNLDVDPQYRDRLAGDYRLRRTSALIDASGTAVPAGDESPTDRNGVARILDGTGDGVAQRDIGAFEYRRPNALLSLATPANTGALVPFTAFESNYPDGQLARYLWDLDGNGTFETDTGSTPRAERVYATPVRITVRLRVVGADGAFDDMERSFAALDRTAPRIITAAVVPSVFAPGPLSTPLTSTRIEPVTTPRPRARGSAARGTSLRSTLSERATLRILIEQITVGRRSGRTCLLATPQRRRLPRCTRYVVIGLLSRYNRLAGPGAVAFSGRLRGKALALGSYRATYTATDPSGNRSAPRRLSFRVVLR